MRQVAFCEQRNAAVVVRVPGGKEVEEDEFVDQYIDSV